MSLLNKNYRFFELNNGLRVHAQETLTQTTAAVLVINYGPAYEQEGEEGLTHFLEHCFLTAGTETDSPEQADMIRSSFGDKGLYSKTYFSEKAFLADMLADDLEKYLRFVSDLVFRPLFDENRFREEKEVVLREVVDSRTSLEARDLRLGNKALFGEHPLSRSKAGKISVLEASSTHDLRAFHKRGYVANNMFLMLVGALPSNVEEVVAKYFENRRSGYVEPLVIPPLELPANPGIIRRPAPDLFSPEFGAKSSSEIYISIVVPPKTSEEMQALFLLSKILGGGDGSRLFVKIRQQGGMAYNVNAAYDGTDNVGRIETFASVSSDKIDDAVDSIFNEIRFLQTNPVDLVTLNSLKRAETYALTKKAESNDGLINARYTMLELGYTPEESLAKLNAVTPEQIMELAHRYLPKSLDDGKHVTLIRDALLENNQSA